MKDEQEQALSLWYELLGNDHQRKPATPTGKIPPGYYDDFDYTPEREDEFGYTEYLQELAEIRRKRAARYEQENNNE